MSRFRLQGNNFLLTWPHFDTDPRELARALRTIAGDENVEYLVCCREQHQDGQWHAHAFLRLRRRINTTNARYFDINGNHGDYKSVYKAEIWTTIKYVKKDGIWHEEGKEPIKTTWSVKEKNELIQSHGIEWCVENGIFSIASVPRIQAGIEALRIVKTRQERRAPIVKWYYGSTGTGKTRLAVKEGGNDFWISPGGLQWFNNYNGQRTAILDDIRVGSCPMNMLLRILDRYTIQVPIKGGFTLWNPEVIIVTCPVRPEKLFVNRETGEQWDHVDQVVRRVTVFRDFDEEPYNGEDEEQQPEAGPQ